jgi:hypothetical protein
MLLTFAPKRLFGAKPCVRTVCGARNSVINRASKNVHYNRGILSVNSLFELKVDKVTRAAQRN